RTRSSRVTSGRSTPWRSPPPRTRATGRRLVPSAGPSFARISPCAGARRPLAGSGTRRRGFLRRLLIVASALALGVALVIAAGAAAPSGHARGLTYAGLNPVQKAHVSGALAAALGPSTSTDTANTATATPGCSTIDPGEEGDEGDDACPP